MKILLITVALISGTLVTAAEESYLSKYLPMHSLIRKVAERETNRRVLLFFKSEKRKQCEYIENVLHRMDQEKWAPADRGIGGYWGQTAELITLARNNALMKNAIRTILNDQSDYTKWAEFEMVSAAATAVQKDRAIRLEKQKQEIEEQKKYCEKHPAF